MQISTRLHGGWVSAESPGYTTWCSKKRQPNPVKPPLDIPSAPACPKTLNLAAWENELCDDPDRDYLLHGIKYGFNIVNDSKQPETIECDNYRSCDAARDAVEAQILEEIREGRYLVTSHKPTIISALGALPKPDGGIRLIHDASRPSGHAINDYATLESHIAYQSVQDAVKLLSPSSYIGKIDLKSAYRLVSTNPAQHCLAGLKWKFKGHLDYTYLVDTRLPFGCRLSVEAFHRLSKAIQRFMCKRGFKTIVYLDDWLVVGDSKEECTTAMRSLTALLRDLGFYIAYSKMEGPSKCLTFLGIEIDVKGGILRLPATKVAELKALLRAFLPRSRASLRQLQHLAGKLAWAANIIRGGRTFLQAVFEHIRPLKNAKHKILLNDHFKSDLHWWINCFTLFNSSPFVTIFRPTAVITTDACTQAAGMTCELGGHLDWHYLNWQMDYPCAKDLHINVKESLAAIFAIYKWAPLLRHCRVLLYTDNITTRSNLRKGASRHSPLVMHHLKHLFWICTLFDITIDCRYLPGAQNINSDAISRLHQPGHLLYWASQVHPFTPFNASLFAVCSVGHMSTKSLHFLLSQVPKLPWSPSLMQLPSSSDHMPLLTTLKGVTPHI